MAKIKANPGLTVLVRDVRFIAADNERNRKRAQQLIERFSEQWADAFDTAHGTVIGEPVKSRAFDSAKHGL